MRSTKEFENLTDLFRSLDLSEAQAEVYREARARIALVGPVNAGKSTLYNCLQGWTVSPVDHTERELYEPAEESLGLFTLIDLPNAVDRSEPVRGYDPRYDYGQYHEADYGQDTWYLQDPALWSLTGVDLVIFVIDGAAGLRPVDYQWFARIRAAGCPLLVVLNKIDLLGDDCDQAIQDLRRRMASPVVAISAREGTYIHDLLLPQILDINPSLAVPLGREVASCRRQAATRLIRRSALMCGLLGVEPMPLLDVPFQLITQMYLVMRLAAMYGRGHVDGPAGNGTGVGNGMGLTSIVSGAGREVLMTLMGGLGLRYLAQQLIKLIPLLGWLLSGALSASSTWLIGWAAVTYFDRAQNGLPLIRVPGGALGWIRRGAEGPGSRGAEERNYRGVGEQEDRQIGAGMIQTLRNRGTSLNQATQCVSRFTHLVQRRSHDRATDLTDH
jgi:uncharacterized protein (DUF697 family)/GTP-binding protein EngB required for normal cell division